MKTQSADTSPEAEQVLIERLRQMPPWKRLQRIAELNHALRVQIIADLRRSHPHADAEEFRRLLAYQVLPPELARLYLEATPKLEDNG